VITCLIGDIYVYLDSSRVNKWWVNLIVAAVIFVILAAIELLGPGFLFT
jgi:hypothetical protein